MSYPRCVAIGCGRRDRVGTSAWVTMPADDPSPLGSARGAAPGGTNAATGCWFLGGRFSISEVGVWADMPGLYHDLSVSQGGIGQLRMLVEASASENRYPSA